jgi:hypothetical protein
MVSESQYAYSNQKLNSLITAWRYFFIYIIRTSSCVFISLETQVTDLNHCTQHHFGITFLEAYAVVILSHTKLQTSYSAQGIVTSKGNVNLTLVIMMFIWTNKCENNSV